MTVPSTKRTVGQTATQLTELRGSRHPVPEVRLRGKRAAGAFPVDLALALPAKSKAEPLPRRRWACHATTVASAIGL